MLFIFIGVMITVPFNRYMMETIWGPYGRDFSPGELVMRSFNASFGQRLGIYFGPREPPNATVMELKILDSENFRRYEAGEDFKVIYSFSGSELSYTFLVFKADTYYFVSKNIGDRETSLLYMFTRSPWYMPYIWTLGLCLIAVGVIGVIATFTLRRNP